MHNKLENTKSSNAMEMYKNVSKTCSELRDKNYQKKTIVKGNVKSFIYFRVYYEWCGKSD